MKVVRSIKHHVNMGNYEWTEIEASIEVEVPDKEDPTLEEIAGEVDEQLQTMLSVDLRQAAKLSDEDTYVVRWKK